MLLTTDDSYVGKKECPKCRSKDNVHRYADGHEYCFGGCGYYLPARLTKDKICALLTDKSLDKSESSVNPNSVLPNFPPDVVTPSFKIGHMGNSEGFSWLKTYGIFNDEIEAANILWSPSQEQLIFPIYKDKESKELLAWQARNFRKGIPKYVSFGKIHEILHILGLTNSTESAIIIVEDLISAIKVSRHYRTMPLFGSACSKTTLLRLRRYTDHVKFWLDSDKFGTAMKLAKVAQQLDLKADVIHTDKDPKSYFNQEIKQLGATVNVSG